MKQKIPCFCDNTFTVDIPDEIDLDTSPEYLEEIMNGSFMNFICSSCGKKHKPEFPIILRWPSRNCAFEAIPEQERMVFYRRKKRKEPHTLETVIGYPELADRLAVVRDGLEPVVVEALKYFLHLKAEEANPDREIIVSYQCRGAEPELPPGDLEFHLYGLRDGEVAVMKVPRQLYEKTAADYKSHPKTELFSSLRVGSYLSVKNMMRGEEIK